MKRRFIAGATCPKCDQQDKVVMYDDDDQQRWRECVSCGFKELLSEEKPITPEVNTRVNQVKPGEATLPHETPIEVISIIDSDKN